MYWRSCCAETSWQTRQGLRPFFLFFCQGNPGRSAGGGRRVKFLLPFCLGGQLPSQKQLKWSELKVGITVVVAGLVLAVLIILISGTGGLFTRKLILKSYFFDAQGLRVGAPVRLSGVDIGNVSQIRVVPNKPLAPVEVA